MAKTVVILLALVVLLPAQAALITRRVVVQPIRINTASEKANPAGILYEAETAKIMAQAGIEVRFLPIKDVILPAFIHVASNIQLANSLAALAQAPGNGAHSDPSVINLWFVQSIDHNPGAVGYALQTTLPFGILRPKNGIAIADSAFTFAGGKGVRDIFAHELGHNLGLYHGMNESGVILSSGEQSLMSRAGRFPSGILDIYPEGARLAQINAAEVLRLHAVSTFVKPLPLEEHYEYPRLTSAPIIEGQPISIAAHTGETVSLSVAASGAAALEITWHKQGAPNPLAHGSTLLFSPAGELDSGSYFAVAHNSAGAATSQVATVSILPLEAILVRDSLELLEVSWEVLAGRRYRLDFRADLSLPWANIATFPASDSNRTVKWTTLNEPGASFYRIVAP